MKSKTSPSMSILFTRRRSTNWGERIVVEATSEDGTIEAVTVADAPGFVVGVQWHPEYWAETDAASNAILRAFGDASREYLAQKRGLAVAAE